MYNAMAASKAGGQLAPFRFDPGPLPDDQIEIAVQYCGICHSDLSMLDNEWQMTTYPFVPGHEVIGRITAAGREITNLKVGQTVGLGWYSHSCMHCRQCMSGNHNLCPTAEMTMIGRYGGFADKVRCHAEWTLPLPDGVDPTKAGPLFCGGITVFNPLIQFGVKPTDHVGVIGIGGLGHLALQFASRWGCDVTAFTSSDSKRDEAMKMGARHVVNSRDSAAMKSIAGSLDFIVSTVTADMDWDAYVAALAPKGRLHFVGVAPKPIPAQAFALISAQKQISGTPSGSPATIGMMLDFCGRHGIAPVTEQFPMTKLNAAMDHLRAGKARYRIVLTNDLK